ncbi:hypothetical protein BY458DRAFT_585844 [Sporodiniella umbellata]|nr:hypothetical protein BY458DRAFT_585844 [Sporodiniella umbellata]
MLVFNGNLDSIESLSRADDQISKFLKKTFIPQEEEGAADNKTPNGSIYSGDSRPNSRPGSIMNNNGFIRDPTRCTHTPDVVGHYYDPMGSKYSTLHGVDPTNTGA